MDGQTRGDDEQAVGVRRSEGHCRGNRDRRVFERRRSGPTRDLFIELEPALSGLELISSYSAEFRLFFIRFAPGGP